MDPMKLLVFLQQKRGEHLRESNIAQKNFRWYILGFPCGTFYYMLRAQHIL